ncbi:FG-GAP repeat domain-containing protein [Kordiimonas laminariae]|uniref:FG-GAP repeat domain-containing protein n=1 Tax=Kordiimonas laminariae TaxID=2917717 RepID=UPI001FF173C5|nr:VCBS repeat-containing protein [Kordiimonas laminariae]MCK0069023.1 VCBS repeat-containing protein [Kordiimonas laminariae]
MYKAVGAALFGVLCFGGNAGAQDLFEIKQLDAGHPVETMEKIHFGSQGKAALLAAGRDRDGAKHFSIFDAAGGNEAILHFTMPEDMLFFDTAKLDGKATSVVFLSSEGVSYFNTESGQIELLVPVQSIFRQSFNPRLNKADFSKDLNGDGLADVLLPDFDGYRLLLGKEAGGFEPEQLLNMQVEMRLGAGTPRYSTFPYYQFDANFDGKDDIVFHQDHSFIVFPQEVDGSFENEPMIIPFDLPVTGNSYKEQVRADERYADQTNLENSTFREIDDINGDGIIDIVTTTDIAKGVFNRTLEFHYYYGKNEGGKLTFSGEADTDIVMKGFSTRNEHIDFGTDGKKDFVAGAANLGIGKIIGIFLSGSTSVDVNFYEQGDNGRYTEKPTYKKKVSVAFNLSSGQSSIPVVEMGDFNGDGSKDLVVSKKEKELQFFMATPGGKNMFARKAVKLKIPLPKNGEYVDALDLNEDGKDDLVFYFDRLNSAAEKVNQITVMLAK